VLRYIPPVTRTRPSDTTIGSVGGNYLSGYGVALDMKKMDYLAVDDRHASSTGSYHPNESRLTRIYLFILTATKAGKGANVDEDSDPIIKLIFSFPENPNAPALHTPLSEDEIKGSPPSLLLLPLTN
jgi:UDP-glucose:glycoprotein glucosyltransferase